MLFHLNHSLLSDWINLIFILLIQLWHRVNQYKACGFQQIIQTLSLNRQNKSMRTVLCTYRCRSMTRSWTSFRLLIRAKVLWLPFVSETNVNHFREWCNNNNKKLKKLKKTSTSAKFLMSLSNAMLLKVARAQLTSKVNTEAAWSNGFSGI